MIWVPKSAFELSGRVLQNNAHITPQVIARALFNMYEITDLDTQAPDCK